MVDCIENCEYDLLVNAVVGFRGLKPTLTSLKKGIDVALANKESLVAGGVLVRKTLHETNTKLYPIDSEHSAIFQSLQGNRNEDVKRLIITASGGSFRDKSRDELSDVTVEQTLKHPNWNMGKRITVDSATMVNKGFEVIEAHYLFDLPYEKSIQYYIVKVLYILWLNIMIMRLLHSLVLRICAYPFNMHYVIQIVRY